MPDPAARARHGAAGLHAGPRLYAQRGLQARKHCEERGMPKVRVQLTAAQGLPQTLPTARRHLREGGDLIGLQGAARPERCGIIGRLGRHVSGRPRSEYNQETVFSCFHRVTGFRLDLSEGVTFMNSYTFLKKTRRFLPP